MGPTDCENNHDETKGDSDILKEKLSKFFLLLSEKNNNLPFFNFLFLNHCWAPGNTSQRYCPQHIRPRDQVLLDLTL